MTRLTPQWMQAGSYAAASDRKLIGAIWPRRGVLGMGYSVSPSTMVVTIAVGSAVCRDGAGDAAGAYLCTSDATETVTIPTAPAAGADRIDIVTVQPSEANTSWVFRVISGTATANPTAPAVPDTETPILQHRTVGGSAGLAAANITDLRDPLHTPVDPAYVAPSLAAGFTVAGGTNSIPGYRKVGTLVYLRGVVNFAAAQAINAVVFTLPVGYRPPGNSLFPSQRYISGATAIAMGGIEVTSAGQVRMNPATTAGGSLWLDGIVFDTI